jgi:DNA-binding transcriptional regulator LsrR (DeoR family)
MDRVLRQHSDLDRERLDLAARAGWLYYIAGNDQGQVAAKLGISRQTAQRLVTLAVTEGLIKVRLDHPLAKCLELSERLKIKYGLELVEVVNSDPAALSNYARVAAASAATLERFLVSAHSVVAAMGTGRTLRAMAESLTYMDCPHHKIVSLAGNIAPDGSATVFDVASRIGERIGAPHYPLPLPLIATTTQERKLLAGQNSIRNILSLVDQADVSFVGIGSIDAESAMLIDGFVKPEEIRSLVRAGAVGEITGWAYDSKGTLIEGLTNDRVLSAPLQIPVRRKVIGVVLALQRFRAVRGALLGKLINGLITTEAMAEQLLEP